jgi:hypothetical protein
MRTDGQTDRTKVIGAFLKLLVANASKTGVENLVVKHNIIENNSLVRPQDSHGKYSVYQSVGSDAMDWIEIESVHNVIRGDW